MCSATTPEAVSGSIKSTDPVLLLRKQQVNGEYILLVTTALTRGKMYLIFEAYNSKGFACQSCQFFPFAEGNEFGGNCSCSGNINKYV